ncbi:radical SAM family heme chaperone HemW [Bradyrhizobium sp. Ai1a-2]|uniref:radical SAM family heme chaperone HemW n=1 Tax=Bradyrhizobium sp. Ai1a-2 TaxID=196490 RepID=UPI0009FE126D|nr:radical SAM family heme chaperone HemW [Bradyrhizobium sp. Ai1a-2]
MTQRDYVRRNIHTYPFKYSYLDPEHYFAKDRAVIYIHIPFCNTKCHFCDYVVYVNTNEDLRESYVQALCNEIASFVQNRTFPAFSIDAVYIGGGTPGVLTASQLVRIMDTVRANFDVACNCEVAVEFDPGTVQADKLAALRDAGFTRMSIGVQSFDEKILTQNNRPHNLNDCFRAWEVISRAGFAHTNIDLIYPLIGLDLPTWKDSLRQAIDMNPTCITAYPLEIWPKTAYHQWLVVNKSEHLPAVGLEVSMCRVALDALEDAGFRRFSTTGYFDPRRCDTYSRYLEYYWRTWPLIGFGVSSKNVINDRLYTNVRSIGEYLRRVQAGNSLMDFATRLTKEQEMRRVMIRGLKMCEVSKPSFLERFGVSTEMVFPREIAALVDRGLVEDTPASVRITREGQVFSSNVFEAFYTSDDLRPPNQGEVQFGLSELVLS